VALDPVRVGFALPAAGWAAYIVASQRAGRYDRPQDSLALSLAMAAVRTSPLAITHAAAVTFSDTTLLVLVVVAVLGTVVPYALEMAALRRLTVSSAGVLFSVEPATAALVGLAALGQSLGLVQVLGVVMVVAAGASVLRDGPT
jgi:inner membrane transporter RhtA